MCGSDVKKIEKETKRVVKDVGDEAKRVYKKVEDERKRVYKDAEDLFQTAVGDPPGPAPAGKTTVAPEEEPKKKKSTTTKTGLGLTILGGKNKGLLSRVPGTKKRLYT